MVLYKRMEQPEKIEVEYAIVDKETDKVGEYKSRVKSIYVELYCPFCDSLVSKRYNTMLLDPSTWFMCLYCNTKFKIKVKEIAP